MVEFALILPYFFVFAFCVFLVLEVMFRAVFISHGSFAAARRVGVQSLGGVPASEYLRRHYVAGGMRGAPIVDAQASMGGNPRVQSVRVTDLYRVLWLTGGRDGIYPALREESLRVSHAPVSTAGTGPRSMGSDNDL